MALLSILNIINLNINISSRSCKGLRYFAYKTKSKQITKSIFNFIKNTQMNKKNI